MLNWTRSTTCRVPSSPSPALIEPRPSHETVRSRPENHLATLHGNAGRIRRGSPNMGRPWRRAGEEGSGRSEERRDGKGGASTGGYRWSQAHSKKKQEGQKQ